MKESLIQKREEFDLKFDDKKRKLTQGDELPPGAKDGQRCTSPSNVACNRVTRWPVVTVTRVWSPQILPVEDMPFMARWHAGGHRAEPAGCAVADERRSDSWKFTWAGPRAVGKQFDRMLREQRNVANARSSTGKALQRRAARSEDHRQPDR